MAAPTAVTPSLPAALEPVAGRPLALAELIELVRAVAAREDVWRPKLRYPQGADHWWSRLHNSAHVDVWLLSWLPGHTTDLHDHGASAAAFTVLQGQLDEVRPTGRQRQVVHPRRTGMTSWVAPHVRHDVRAAGSTAAVSVHAYSPPLTEMTFWAEDSSGVLRPARTVLTDEPEQA